VKQRSAYDILHEEHILRRSKGLPSQHPNDIPDPMEQKREEARLNADPLDPIEAVIQGQREGTRLAHKTLRDGNEVAVYIGTQPGFRELPAFDLFNLTRPLAEYPEGATVGVTTLQRLGYSAPRKPVSATAPTPKKAASDRAHDEKTEGYARRPFRKSPHDE
jgi:hypothetical protein